ncbi:arsenate reductase family protein [Planococcus lenghuensis]|uniref:Arsenate reductase family protein n=1 Tax=Planococcus lenghuensis TaxID=2213202 RepID=A0A1Q2KWW7_9BACL|nr:arsenate reductase family protein [Planococcus lenghuensis]AQQ52681.1 hypothetical protein B0X71_05925 [Planococcus lenghuensis]
MVTFYSYPKCSTCRKAKKWLDNHEVAYEEIHIVDSPPSKEEIRAFYQKSGLDLKKFFNTSGMKYRELGLKDRLKDMGEEEQLELLASDGKLIKRPLVVSGDQVTAGFKEETFSQAWK